MNSLCSDFFSSPPRCSDPLANNPVQDSKQRHNPGFIVS